MMSLNNAPLQRLAYCNGPIQVIFALFHIISFYDLQTVELYTQEEIEMKLAGKQEAYV